MKLLHAMSGNPAGATELAFERTVTALAGEDVQQKAIFRADNERFNRLDGAGIATVQLPFKARLDFSSKRRLNAEIASFAPDLVISWTADVASQVAPFAGKHLGYIGEDFPATKVQGCHHLFAASPQRVDRVTSAGWPEDKIDLLPPLIVEPARQRVARKEFFTPDSAKLIVTVGNLEKEDSVRILLDAVARIAGLYLWVIGDGTAKPALEKQSLEIGIKPRTRFIGWRYDSTAVLAAADLVVCPAHADDLGDGVLEAWACRKPVIATDSIGPGLLIRHRDNGVLVPLDDTRSLSEAIKWVMQDSSFAQRIAEKGYDSFVNEHAPDKILPRYLSVFENVIHPPVPEADSPATPD